MMSKVGDIELDQDNVEFNNAAEFIRHTDKLVYLTGKAGTGKTTFLKYIKGTTDKNTVILAPTGVAAINAGGVTIHSFFQIPLGPFVPDDSRLSTSSTGGDGKVNIYTTFKYKEEKRKIIENLELLIIDEVSMVRCDILDVIDRILKVFRRKPHLPFGGVQVILIGDTFQLPPIADNEQWEILSQFYKTSFFFSSKVIELYKPTYIELKKIYRQNEKEFIDLLNKVRVSQVTEEEYKVLNAKYNPSFSGNGSDYIILATHNKIVYETNLTKLNELETELFTYKATVTGIFPDNTMPTDQFLKLKVGAQVMFIKNDTGRLKRYYNGKIGKVKELRENEIIVAFDDDSEVKVDKAVWNNIQYTYNKEKNKIEEEVIGTFEQFPLKLAWAITVHKSQGLTFEKVIADLGRAFAAGQVYVALSRCTTFSGLVLKTHLHKHAIRTDPKVLEFAQNETPSTLVVEQLNTGKADFYYKKAREGFEKGNFQNSFNAFQKALKFRNDVDTEGFRRYFLVRTKRLFSYRKHFSDLAKKYTQQQEGLLETKLIVDGLDSENDKLRQDISDQSTSIQWLVEKSKYTEKINTDLLLQINGLKKQVDKSEEKIQQLQKSVKLLDTLYQKEKGENEMKGKELDRLKKLKWYQKLIGKD